MKHTLIARFKSKDALVGIVGLGYVGLPLLLRYHAVGVRVLGIDIDAAKVTRFIELAGEVNADMPAWVVGKLTDALNARYTSIRGSRILVLGIAYKKNVALMEMLRSKGAQVEYADPHIPVFPKMRAHHFDLASVALTPERVASYDLVLLVTDHASFDYEMIQANARLLVDTRGVYRKPADNIVKA